MYQALYRKWRPKIFDDVIGQQHITETLKTQVRTGHLSHAYIFIGTRGTGKTTCARILAKAVNCEHPVNGNPCNKCPSCLGIEDGSVLDIVELDAASNTGVDNVRDLREEAVFSPASVRKRVYIIDEVHMLSLAAFNALLKIIEEPPPHLMFILATTELQKVPATILSRCQRHSFHRIPTETLTAYLQEIAAREDLQLDKTAAGQIARLAEGGVRDALSILDQCSGFGHITTETVYETMGLAGNRNTLGLMKQILRKDTAQALQLFQKSWMDGKEPAAFLGELSGLLRDVLIVKAAKAGADDLITGNFERDELNAVAASMTGEQVLYMADTLQDALIRIRQVRNPRTVAEICIVRLCDTDCSDSTSALRARISALEEAHHKALSPERTEEKVTLRVPPEPVAATALPEQKDIHSSVTAADPASEIPQEEERQVQPAEPAPKLIRQEKSQESPRTDSVFDAGQAAVIIKEAKEKLPMEIRFSVDDPSRFRVRLYPQELLIEAAPGFLFERLKKAEIRAVFSEAAAAVLKKAVPIRLAELRPEARKEKDLNDLRQFPEVKFIS